MGREDARVQLHVPRLVHAVHVPERRCDAEVRGHGCQGLLHSPDLVQPRAKEGKGSRGNEQSVKDFGIMNPVPREDFNISQGGEYCNMNLSQMTHITLELRP